jgi:uncharacterized protein
MLADVAPVLAVRGNTDRGSDFPPSILPETRVVELGDGHFLYVLHDLARLDLDPAAAGFQIVVYGHSHQPAIEIRGGVLFVNPGSAGPRRLQLPVSVGLLEIGPAGPAARIVRLGS